VVTHNAESVAPPEVHLDLCGRQILAPGFPRYLPCAKECGYLIGCGDAVDTVWHESCETLVHPTLIDGDDRG
jgi:hypothetical protein